VALLVDGVRVPESLAQLDQTSARVGHTITSLKSAGYVVSDWGPNAVTGTLDIDLANSPPGSLGDLTSYFRAHVAPDTRVVATGVGNFKPFYNRYNDVEKHVSATTAPASSSATR